MGKAVFFTMKNNLVTFVLLVVIWLFIPVHHTLALQAAGMLLYKGIDVSEYQGDIDFEAVVSDGIEVVYIKSSEGFSFVDPYFEQHYQGAKQVGLRVGFYHFVTAETVEQAMEQARFFVSTISGKEVEGKLAMDFESFTALTSSEVNEISLAFLQEVEKLSGKQAVIYSDVYNATNVFDESLTNYDLWVAQYEVDEPSDAIIWSTWAGWQYSDTGNVSGIDGEVDLDYFTDAMLLQDTSPVEPPPSEHDPKEITITYRVQAGDTLSEIAQRFDTTVAAIMAENNIQNPNLIYVNQILTIIVPKESQNNGTTIEYIVKRGDTLSEIAQRYNTTVAVIVAENDIQNPNLIYVNEVLRIPVGESSVFVYVVKAGDTLSELAQRYNTTVGKLVQLNDISNPNLIFVNERLLIPEG
ncbi:MAG: GH25 family lysozyme [Bacillus sp. (in: firmicutes)]